MQKHSSQKLLEKINLFEEKEVSKELEHIRFDLPNTEIEISSELLNVKLILNRRVHKELDGAKEFLKKGTWAIVIDPDWNSKYNSKIPRADLANVDAGKVFRNQDTIMKEKHHLKYKRLKYQSAKKDLSKLRKQSEMNYKR